MISFVWSATYPFISGTGGSETYTAGHMRELQRRGIPTRVITIGYGEDDGRQDFPDLDFVNVESESDLSALDDRLVFVTYPPTIATKHPSYTILHCPPFSHDRLDPRFNIKAMRGQKLMATSKYAARMWAAKLGRWITSINVVYPFAAAAFAQARRAVNKTRKTRILYAGRLTPDKGIYTLLAALHLGDMPNLDYELTVTTAGSHTPEGKIILSIIKAHPLIKVVPAYRTPTEAATLMASQDIVVMPSTNIFWQEMFGMLSVEAQHAGCRVVASNSGGLKETNCGGLQLVKPDNPSALAAGIIRAAKQGCLTAQERQKATRFFTVEKSVDDLLTAIGYTAKQSQTMRLRGQRVQIPKLQPQLALIAGRLKR